MSAYNADCTDLLMAGWGEHDRGDIPDDWQMRRGPDPIPGIPDANREADKEHARVRRQTFYERRTAWEAARRNARSVPSET